MDRWAGWRADQRRRGARVQAVAGGVSACGRAAVTADGQLRLVTSNAFDCTGASTAGMRTVWVNRSVAPRHLVSGTPRRSLTKGAPQGSSLVRPQAAADAEIPDGPAWHRREQP
jgi:hypothetical protein